MSHKPNEHAKQPSSTKRGPGRYHKNGTSHGRAIKPTTPLYGLSPQVVFGGKVGRSSRDLQPQRLDGESFETYRERRAANN